MTDSLVNLQQNELIFKHATISYILHYTTLWNMNVKMDALKWLQSEICIVINDKSQDSMAKHFIYDGLLHYKFSTLYESTFIWK